MNLIFLKITTDPLEVDNEQQEFKCPQKEIYMRLFLLQKVQTIS